MADGERADLPTVAGAPEEFADATVAVLGTVTADGAPHLVPVVFAVHDAAGGPVVYTAVDAKPKATTRLRRLANVAANPRVSLLVQHYSDDWTALWWVRADGAATVVTDDGETTATARALLREKYVQYGHVALDGPVIAVRVTRWSSWHG